MGDRALHNLTVPQDSQVSQESRLQRQLSQLAALGQDANVVESLASDPDDQTLEVAYRGEHAAKLTAELEELVASTGFETVVYYDRDGTAPEDGYYSPQSRSVAPADPHDDRLQAVAPTRLSLAGTRRSHWRAVETAQAQVNNPFGTDQTAYVGVPAAASKARWHNTKTGATAEPTLQATRTGETGDVEVYDANVAPYASDRLELVYDADYDQDAPTAVQAWDTLGNASRDTTDAQGTSYQQWQRVFRADHDYQGLPVLSTRLIRLTFDESSNTLSAETWDTGTSSWSSVSLGSSNWELYDLDVTGVAPARIDAQVEFRDPTASPTEFYSLDLALRRGFDLAHWAVPDGQSGNLPSGLDTRLDPIAEETILDATESAGLTARSQTRK